MAMVLDSNNFDDEINGPDKVVMVDFWAPWCGPCQILGPIVDEIAEEFKDNEKVTVAKVNVDENAGIAQKFGVVNIPNIKFFKQGEVVDELIGVRSKEEIIEKLQGLI